MLQRKKLWQFYEGGTARSARLMGAEHLKGFEEKKGKSVLFKHQNSDHKNENVKFKMEITQKLKML